MPQRRRSAKGQQEIDISSRGKQLKDLAAARFGCPYKRLIVRELDDHIRDGRCWDLTIEELAQRCEINQATLRRKLAELQAESIVGMEEIDRSAKKRFWLCRSNIEGHCVARKKTLRGKKKSTVGSHRTSRKIARPGQDRPPGEAAAEALELHRATESCTVQMPGELHGANVDLHGANVDLHGANVDLHGANVDLHRANDTVISANKRPLARTSAHPQTPRGDPLVFDAQLIALWNDCEGVAQHSQSALSYALAQKLDERLQEPGWWERAQQALGKFPLSNGVVIGLRKFLEPETVDEILGGVHDWQRDNSRAESRERSNAGAFAALREYGAGLAGAAGPLLGEAHGRDDTAPGDRLV